MSNIRKGNYEGLGDNQDEGETPISGAQMHPLQERLWWADYAPCGNVNLRTNRIDIANKIAHNIRERNGGFKNVKGMGVALEERGEVQVSMNLERLPGHSHYRVLETIRRRSSSLWRSGGGYRLIGLVRRQALLDVASISTAEDFHPNQVLENRLG